MLRRRLRLSYSSEEEEEECLQPPPQPPPPPPQPEDEDEEDEEDDIEVQVGGSTMGLHTVTLTTPSPTLHHNPNTTDPPSIDISDDDLMEVIDEYRVEPQPSSIPDQSFRPASAPSSGTGSVESSGCPISDSLRRLGLSLRREWLDSCVRGLEGSVPGFAGLDVAQKAKLCFESFLSSDMNRSGGGVLPENVASMHLVDLAGPFVLQVDEIVNISCPLRGRYQNASSGVKRCLKLSMTDGVQRLFGMEYRPIKDLEVLAPAGLKVVLCNVNVRHGLFMLVPEAFEVLGGLFHELDAARQRLVQEVNKPPRGKRTRNGVLPPLATRATHAAWPTDSGSVQDRSNNFTSQGSDFIQEDRQVLATPALETRTAEESAVPIARENAENNRSFIAFADDQPFYMVDEEENPFIPSGDSEIPFTYLASLSAKWAAMKEKAPCVKGTIKCFLTGVKGFQYKQRTTFELQAYVDDGSLISEIIIDHNVVQKGIGHSPKEVTAALASSDRKLVSVMRETLKQFQIFLANFEGTMLVEINESSPFPIALEMNQGCSASDTWSLLRRLKSANSDQTLQHQHLDPIDVSP